MVVLCPFIDGLDPLRDLYSPDPKSTKIITECSNNQGSMGMFTLHDGFLFRGPQLPIPTSSLRLQIIREIHSGSLSGSFGVAKILQLLCDEYFWPTMRQDTNQFTCKCYTCQTAEGRHITVAMYTPLPTPLRLWINVAMDFITWLYKTKDGYNFNSRCG